MKKLLLLLLAGVTLAGCAAWSRVEKAAFVAPDNSYGVDLPVGWVRLLMGRSENEIFITNDGPGIERIEISRRDNKEAFPKIKKSADESMLALELAELMIAELKANEAMSNLEVVGNSPAMVSGMPGFRLEVRMKNDKGVGFEKLVYGVSAKTGFYLLSYQATQLHYFRKYEGVFEKAVESFQLKSL